MLTNRIKDKDDTTYHTWQWLDFLNGESIASSVWSVPTGIIKDSDGINGSDTTIWLSGGTDKGDYKITNQVTTSSGRKKTQSFIMKIREQ